MMDSTSITCFQRRKPQRRQARRLPRGSGLGLAAALAFFAWTPGPGPDSALTVRSAAAQDFAAAGQHFASAQDAFAQGKYELAAKEFQAAYDITKDPSMLVNIGESWQRAGDGKKAMEGYRAYLAAQPQAPDRGEIEGRIKAIETALSAPTPGDKPGPTPETPAGAEKSPPGPATPEPASQLTPGNAKPGPAPEPAKTEPPKPTAPPPASDAAAKADASSKPTVTPPEGRVSTLRKAGWITVAVAVALATSGAIVGLGAQDRADELRRRTTILVGNQPPVYDAGQAEAYTSLQSEGNTYNQAGIALLSAAGAVAVTAGILFIADYVRRPPADTKPKGSWALLPTLVPGSGRSVTGGLAASGSF
jgi:tetratricopeptide (TPR) repeat protein